MWRWEGGQRTLIFDSQRPKDEPHGIIGRTNYLTAVLSFSRELAAPCSVRIETWNRGSGYTVTQPNLTQPFTLDLPSCPAHYTIYASFHDRDGNLCETEFRFDLGEIGGG